MEPSEKIKSIKIKYRIAQREAVKKAAEELAQIIPEIIRLRTRQEGQGTNGQLKELSESYIKQRAGEIAFYTIGKGSDRKVIPYKPSSAPDLHPDTTPSKSNLTATGQLLDSITGKRAGDRVNISLKGKRKKELSGAKSKLTNDEVGKYVRENGREFLKLSVDEKQEAIDLATQIILEQIKDALK